MAFRACPMFLSLSGVTDNWQSPILNYNTNPKQISLTNTQLKQQQKRIEKRKRDCLCDRRVGRGRAGGALACSGLNDDAIMDVELGLSWGFWYRWLYRFLVFLGIVGMKKVLWEMGFDVCCRREREIAEWLRFLELTSDDTADFISFHFLCLGTQLERFRFWGPFFCFSSYEEFFVN